MVKKKGNIRVVRFDRKKFKEDVVRVTYPMLWLSIIIGTLMEWWVADGQGVWLPFVLIFTIVCVLLFCLIDYFEHRKVTYEK